jgi:4-diphosphocytidyl-2-C-methyl-D-erythritol kinase
VEALAPAKVNLVLRIGGRRADGYHDLASLMVALDVGDRVAVAASDATVVRAPGLAGGDTLVTRALALLAAETGHRGGWRVELDKRLPVGAGLGGGSADAGVALRLANATLREPLPSADLGALAARVGSDVPFFAAGAGAALVEGRGERLRPIAVRSRFALALAWPGVPLATADVYAAASAGDLAGAVASIEEAASGDLQALAAAVRNDLAAPAEALCPPTAALRRALARAPGALGAAVSGSGSAVFGLFADRAAASRALEGLPAPAWAAVASPCGILGG